MKKLLVLGLLVYGAYLLTLQAPMLGLLWIVLLYWAGFNVVLFLLVLGIRSVFRFAAGRKDGMSRLTEARKAQIQKSSAAGDAPASPYRRKRLLLQTINLTWLSNP